MKIKLAPIFLCILSILPLVSCENMREKVSPAGILIANTDVDDRVEMSYLFYRQHHHEYNFLSTRGDYSFLVGADSHLTKDSGRLDEMFNIALDDDDLLVAHLGDIADTKAEYYARLDSIVSEAKSKYIDKNYIKINEYEYIDKKSELDEPIPSTLDEIDFPFYPVVGNHDITRNGWAMWSNIFHSSFYEVHVLVLKSDGDMVVDRFIFLDTASGTLGAKQIKLIEEGAMEAVDNPDSYRNTFVFSHTNIFRPQFNEMASTFTREETFFLLDKFEKWNVTAVFCGHVHTWDERNYNGVHYLTLDTMCEKERTAPGNYIIRFNVTEDGEISWSDVPMKYVPEKKK